MQISEYGIVYADSSMAGMPSLDNTAGSLIAVLDAVLPAAGWEKAFSGTNKAAYRSSDVTGTRLFLRVDDTTTTYATTLMYESMSDIDTGTGVTPTLYYHKSNSGAVAWRMFVDSQAFYLFGATSTYFWSRLFFGDILSFQSPDAWRSAIIGHTTTSYNSSALDALGSASGSYLARAYNGLGSATGMSRYSHGRSTALGSAGATYPNPTDNALLIALVDCWENSNNIARGAMPGLYSPLHGYSSLTDAAVVTDPVNNRDFLLTKTANTTFVAMDITGPWR